MSNVRETPGAKIRCRVWHAVLLAAMAAVVAPAAAAFAAEQSQPKYKIVLGGDRASYVLLPIVPARSGVTPNLGGITLKGGDR